LLAPLKTAKDPWPTSLPTQFRGYRLGQDGVPTFLYRLANCDIEERISANDQAQLVRHLTIRGETNRTRLWIQPVTGKSLTQKDTHTYSNASGLTVSVHGVSATGSIRPQANSGSAWILPLPAKANTQVELRYQW